MAEILAEIDLSAVDRSMADVEARAKRMGPAFRDLRRPLRQDQRDHSKGQKAPNGSWPPRSPFTEARRQAHNRRVRSTKALRTISIGRKQQSRPKKILGRLPGAIVVTVGDLFIRATSRVDWSGVHQWGGTAAHRAKIPQRMFLWLSDRFLDKATDALVDHVMKNWGK